MKKIAILGAGVTGLTAAYELSKKGYEVTIFEKSNELGGLATSFTDEAGCVYDYGPHQFFTDNPRLVKLLKDLLGKDLLIRRKNVTQYFFNKYVPYPPKPTEYFTKVPLKIGIMAIFEVIMARIEMQVNSKPDYSFESWTKSRYGKTLYNKYFKPYTIKTWGVNPDDLDPSTASSRISFNSIFDLFFKTIKHYITKKDDFSTTHNPLKQGFYYPRGGNVKLMQRLYQECLNNGVNIKKNHEITEIVVKNFRVTKLKFSNKRNVSNLDYVINTAPLTSLNKMLSKSGNFPLKFRDMIFVFICFEKKKVSDCNWIYYPNKEIIFQRICEFSNFKADMCPENKSNIAAEITCFKDDEIWNMKDEDIIKRTLNDLKKVHLLKGNEKYIANVVRKQYIYPIQIKGFQNIIKDYINKEIAPIKNLVTIGRQGLFKYCNQNECMEMAQDVVSQIENGTKKFKYYFESKWKSEAIRKDPGVLKEDVRKLKMA